MHRGIDQAGGSPRRAGPGLLPRRTWQSNPAPYHHRKQAPSGRALTGPPPCPKPIWPQPAHPPRCPQARAPFGAARLAQHAPQLSAVLPLFLTATGNCSCPHPRLCVRRRPDPYPAAGVTRALVLAMCCLPCTTMPHSLTKSHPQLCILNAPVLWRPLLMPPHLGVPSAAFGVRGTPVDPFAL